MWPFASLTAAFPSSTSLLALSVSFPPLLHARTAVNKRSNARNELRFFRIMSGSLSFSCNRNFISKTKAIIPEYISSQRHRLSCLHVSVFVKEQTDQSQWRAEYSKDNGSGGQWLRAG